MLIGSHGRMSLPAPTTVALLASHPEAGLAAWEAGGAAVATIRRSHLWNMHADAGAGVGAALNLEGRADGLGPFSHGTQTQVARISLRGSESGSIIGNLQARSIGAMVEP